MWNQIQYTFQRKNFTESEIDNSHWHGLYWRIGEPIYYHEPNEMWNVAGETQKLNNFMIKF